LVEIAIIILNAKSVGRIERKRPMKTVEILKAPDEYWNLTPAEKANLTNGCGPKAIEPLIPDSILGLSIEEA
jgi:hypothetical protein